MAQLFGIDFLSPDEVRAQRQQELVQAQVSGDPSAIGAVAQRNSLFQLFGDPEEQQAQELQDALTKSASLEQKTGEDDFDFQIRQAKSIREGTAAIDPTVALQANEQILGLTEAKLQQRRLKAQTDTSEFELKENRRMALLAKSPIIFEFDPQTETQRPHRILDPEMSQEEVVAALQAEQAANPKRVLDLGSGTEFLALEADVASGGRRSGLNNSTIDKRIKGLTDGKGFAENVSFLTAGLVDDVNALAFGAELTGQAGGVAAGLDRFQQEYLNDFDEDGRAAASSEGDAVIDAAIERDSRARELTQNSAASRARIKGMAYKLAKTLDPGGRLSDQDVEMAIEMIVGNGDPVVLRQLLRQRLNETVSGLQVNLDLARAGHLQGDIGRKEADRFEAAVLKAEQDIEAFSDAIQRSKGASQERALQGQPAAGGSLRTRLEAEKAKRGR